MIYGRSEKSYKIAARGGVFTIPVNQNYVSNRNKHFKIRLKCSPK